MNNNTDRNRTDKDFTDFSKLSKEELDDIADDLFEKSKYPTPMVTPDLLKNYDKEPDVKDTNKSKR